jgi:Ser/Thr protein kinase RdoA (MazF antagonist)
MTPEQVADLWGGAQDIRLLRDRENKVYSGQFPFGRAALRLHRPGYQSGEAIRSELWWCAALANAGVPVPRALPGLNGELLQEIAPKCYASVISWIDGEPMGEAGQPLPGARTDHIARHYALGALLAGFHGATDALDLPGWFYRPRWDAPGLVGDSPFWGRFWDHPDASAQDRTALIAARDLIAQELGDFTGSFGLIHADVLRENVLFGGDMPHLIDFDDSGFGWRLYDLGTVMSQNLSEPDPGALAQALIEGYRTRRPLSHNEARLLPLFTLARTCASVGWTMPRLAPGHPICRRHIARAVGLAQATLAGRVDWVPA